MDIPIEPEKSCSNCFNRGYDFSGNMCHSCGTLFDIVSQSTFPKKVKSRSNNERAS